MRHWAASAGSLLTVLLLAHTGARAAGDYDPADATAWNGLGYLLETAKEAKVSVTVSEDLDLSELEPGDVVLWLYPNGAPPVDGLMSFVEDGGNLIVADDAGAADELFEAAGVERRPGGPTDHAAWYQEQAGFPVLSAEHGGHAHFLFFNVDKVVANHPSVLSGRGETIAAFDNPHEALVIEQQHGEGSLLLIGDPSIFLNEMLRRFYGNKQFAANVMRVYCDPDDCAVRILLPDSAATGRYQPSSGFFHGIPRQISKLVEEINTTLDGLRRALGRPPWIGMLAVLIALFACVGWLLVTAPGRARAAIPALRLGPVAETPTQMEARGLADSEADADFLSLARALVSWARDSEPLFARAGLADDTSQRGRVARDARLRIEREATTLLASDPPAVSSERFLLLYDQVRALQTWLDEHRAGKRATRRRSGPTGGAR